MPIQFNATALLIFTLNLPLFSLAVDTSVEDLSKCTQVAKTYIQCSPNSLKMDSLTGDFNFKNGDRANCSEIAAILKFPYAKGKIPLPILNPANDPGRVRSDTLNFAIYGRNESMVRDNSVNVNFLNAIPVRVSNLNGAARQLQKISDELIEISKTNIRVAQFFTPYISKKEEGIYGLNWRVVAGTNRLSNHSFGVAVDILAHDGPQYWLWDLKSDLEDNKASLKENAQLNPILESDVVKFSPRTNTTFPQEIVDTFEKNGFIWGGKWYHYDIMHFEYRPEFFPDLKLDCRSL